MLLYPQITISCDGDGCDYEETIELTCIDDSGMYEVTTEDIEGQGWKVKSLHEYDEHYCGDCQED